MAEQERSILEEHMKWGEIVVPIFENRTCYKYLA
jgi:hypothetical protein